MRVCRNMDSQLKEQKCDLEKRKKFMEDKRDQELAKATELLKKKTDKDRNKKAALQHLKKKNMYSEHADTVESYIRKKDAQIMKIEHILNMDSQIIHGKGAIMEREQLEKLMRESGEVQVPLEKLMRESGEIQAALTAPIAGQDPDEDDQDPDEDDLLAELEVLEQEVANESLGEVPLQAAETDEERQLAASME